jgi:hypothetical protein
MEATGSRSPLTSIAETGKVQTYILEPCNDVATSRTYGPFRLGILSRPLGVIAVLGGVFIVGVGLQPPTAILISDFIGILVLLLGGWFGFDKRRFPGPPTTDSAIRDHQHEIMREEEAISGA